MKAWAAGFGIYLERRVAVILLLGFSSGLPLLLVYSTLSARLTEAGVTKTMIGLFAWASTAYAFKFLWSPLVDRLPVPGLTAALGQRRAWLLLSQAATAGAMIGLGASDPGGDLQLTALWAIALAFASATQDIAIDAYRIETLDDASQGAGAANYVIGYRVATLAAGGGALIIADFQGWFMAYCAMAALMAVGMITVLVSPEPPAHDRVMAEGRPGTALREAVIAPFADFMGRRGWLAILAFIALYKYGDALLGVMANPFYLEIGFSKSEIGVVSKGYGFVMTLLGGVCGGWMVARLGIMRALLACGVAQALSNLVFAWQAHVGYSLAALALTISVENLTGGMATVAFVAYLSSLCNVAYTATQYALLSSLMAFARTFLSSGGGWLADHMDWVSYFVLTTAAALPGLALLWWMMRRYPPEEQPPPAKAASSA